jgi:hypothetical protein
MTTIATAAREYASRPADERYGSVADLVKAAVVDKEQSVERTYNLKDLRAVPYGQFENGEPATVAIEGPRGAATMTHWAFGQLCRQLGAPSNYLRELPPALTAECLNHGLVSSIPGTATTMLVQANGGTPRIRAATSDSYGRVWDADFYGAVDQTILQRDKAWTTPPTWSGESAGAYRGDRDSFVIVVNGGSIVIDPSLRNGTPDSRTYDRGDGRDAAGMYRGLLLRNSEVGAASVDIQRILFRYICGNHMLWGAVIDRNFRRRHVGVNTLRDTMREVLRIAREWTGASASRDEAIIRLLISHEIAATKEGVVDELRALGATEEQAKAAYAACEVKENCSPRSYWGAVQGLTRNSQEASYQNDRYQLDQLAAKVLARGAQLVRV